MRNGKHYRIKSFHVTTFTLQFFFPAITSSVYPALVSVWKRAAHSLCDETHIKKRFEVDIKAFDIQQKKCFFIQF